MSKANDKGMNMYGNKDQMRMPIVEALLQHMRMERTSAHVPGHKTGKGLDPLMDALVGQAYMLDFTELPDLDDLHRPDGVIAEAQRLAAFAFGADDTYFLVGGSTAGNLAALLSVLEVDDVALIARHAHQSVWNGLTLARAQGVMIEQERDDVTTWSDVERALAEYPDARLVVLTSPNYDGVTSDVEAIATLAHARGCLLMVDEAHGAHFGFSSAVPRSALSQGADLVVQSTHKMLTSLTQTGMLHLKGTRISRHRVQAMLRVVQSSSPSYLLLASLDAARKWVMAGGDVQIGRMAGVLEEAKSLLNAERETIVQGAAERERDPFKWQVSAESFHCTSLELRQALEREFGIYPEKHDAFYVLLAWSPASARRDVERVVKALLALRTRVYADTPLPTAVCRVYEAVGSVLYDAIVPYPPGIPLLFAGDCLTEEKARAIEQLWRAGVAMDGIHAMDGRVLSLQEVRA
ncbi:aminotransferase class I/II-fold pyridoxal phosphate-dependent enzyme [Ferroacidibacillus organovorans]|nr:aminotransferase class I/II-fold pyridoxal phosphate-dependent enzyme [Ferroacidibacillus organovorans]